MVSFWSAFLLSTPAIAQAVADQAATADPTPLRERLPVTETDGASPSDQPVASPPLGQGTKAQAEHSAEATAHKSVNDPNNQLGTSTSGRTRPIVQADGTPQPLPSAAPQAAAQ